MKLYKKLIIILFIAIFTISSSKFGIKAKKQHCLAESITNLIAVARSNR